MPLLQVLANAERFLDKEPLFVLLILFLDSGCERRLREFIMMPGMFERELELTQQKREKSLIILFDLWKLCNVVAETGGQGVSPVTA